MTKKLSLQSILNARRSTEFVGRTIETQFFLNNKNATVESRKFILNIFGQGGIGKTTLVRKISQENNTNGVSSYCDENQNYPLDIMSTFLKQFGEQDEPMKTFAESYKKYLEIKEKVEKDPELPQGMPSMIGEAITKIGLGAIKEIPGAKLGISLVGEENIIKKAGELTAYISKKIGNKDEVKLALEPVDTLTPTFVNCLNEIMSKKHVVLIFDTYEFTGPFIEAWLLKILEGYYGELTTNFTIVIASRLKLGPIWSDLTPLCAFFELDPLTEDEAEMYLRSKGMTNEVFIKKIVQLSEGVPLWLSIFATQDIENEKELENPRNIIIDRLLKWSTDQDYRAAALKCAVPRVFNKDVLDALLPADLLEKIYGWLKQQPYVRQNSTYGWSYHQLIRKIMVEHLKDDSPKTWKEINEILITYYAAQHEETTARGESHRNGYMEVIYHQLLIHGEIQLLNIFDLFLTLLITGEDFSPQLIGIIEEAQEIVQSQDVGTLLTQVKNGVETFYYGSGLEGEKSFVSYLNDIEKRYIALGIKADKLYSVRATLLIRKNQNQVAKEDIKKGIDINPGMPSFYLEMANALENEQHYDEAINEILKAIELNDEHIEAHEKVIRIAFYKLKDAQSALRYADNFIKKHSNIAQAYETRAEILANEKKYNLAIEDISRAIELQPQRVFYWQQRARLYERIGELELAVKDFDNSININPEDDYQFAARAAFYLRNGNPQNSIADLTTAIILRSKRIEKQESTKTKKQRRLRIGDRVMYIGSDNWYEQRGDIFYNSKEYDKALADFLKELEKNENEPLLLCKIGLSFSRSGDDKNAKKYFRKGLKFNKTLHGHPHELAETYAYLGVAHSELGESSEALKMYDKALELQPDNVNYLFWKSITALNLNLLPTALDAIERGISNVRKTNTILLWQKINVLIKMQDTAKIMPVLKIIWGLIVDNLAIKVKAIFLIIILGEIENYKDQISEVKTTLSEQSLKDSDPELRLCIAGLQALETKTPDSIAEYRKILKERVHIEGVFDEKDNIWRFIMDKIDNIN